jgi:hypothetical protein
MIFFSRLWPGPVVLLLGSAVAAGLVAGPLTQRSDAPSPPVLARMWDAEHVSSPVSPLVDHAEVKSRLEAIAATRAGVLRVREVGRSLEGREIWDVAFGTGPYVVLMWSQMHGDEPTATSALFDVYEYIRRHEAEPAVRQLLSALTVHTVPMLNPDGAERFQRRNVQSIDINRDALLLQTPEGRLLKSLRDSLKPAVGFNLHNQSWRTTVGKPPKGAAVSLLAVAYDEARSMSEGRLLTRRLGAVVRDALEPFALGRIGRYDESFEIRAFGDNLTLWGTPVLLIETGPWPEANPDPMLVRLNYTALIHALHALANGSVHKADPARYDSLPENEAGGFYTVIRNVAIITGAGIAPFTGDVGLVANRRVRVENGRRLVVVQHSIDDIGDLRTAGGLFEVDGGGKVLMPLLPDAAVGNVVTLPESGFPSTISIGAPANLMLVTPLPEGRYRVERVFMFRTSEVVSAKGPGNDLRGPVMEWE